MTRDQALKLVLRVHCERLLSILDTAPHVVLGEQAWLIMRTALALDGGAPDAVVLALVRDARTRLTADAEFMKDEKEGL